VVVFESGAGSEQSVWMKVLPGLTPCLTTVTYDRPGIGDSPPRADRMAPLLAADDARLLRAELQLRGLKEPFILVGHSIGGLYVQAFARMYPGLVAGLVSVDGSSPEEPPGVFVTKSKLEPGTALAAEIRGEPASAAAIRAGPRLPPVPFVVLAATNHDMSPALEARWREVQARTAAESPRGRVVVVESGHYIQQDRPQTVANAVLDVAAEAGLDVTECRPRGEAMLRGKARPAPRTQILPLVGLIATTAQPTTQSRRAAARVPW
jgi:pimeloyl-ACP methyl ester carboxylesterase